MFFFFHIIFVFGTYSAKDRQPHCVFNVFFLSFFGFFFFLVFETRRLSRTLKSFGLLFKCQGRGLLSRKTSCVGCSTLIQCLSTSFIRGGLSRTLCWVIIRLKANKHQWNISFLYKQSVLNVYILENCTMIHAISISISVFTGTLSVYESSQWCSDIYRYRMINLLLISSNQRYEILSSVICSCDFLVFWCIGSF